MIIKTLMGELVLTDSEIIGYETGKDVDVDWLAIFLRGCGAEAILLRCDDSGGFRFNKEQYRDTLNNLMKLMEAREKSKAEGMDLE